MTYLDIDSLEELPILAKSLRFFDTIGGTKSYRCFIAPCEYPRNKFLLENEKDLDRCLVPIYKNRDITIRQDTSCPLPGFYIVSPDNHYRSLDRIPELEYMRLMFLIFHTRRGLRDVCGIEFSYLLYEEKANTSCNVHFWILPIIDVEKYPRMYNFDVKKYMDSFVVEDNYLMILNVNEKMRRYFDDQNIIARDNDIFFNMGFCNEGYFM